MLLLGSDLSTNGIAGNLKVNHYHVGGQRCIMENGVGENDPIGALFDQFCHASTCKHILTSFQQLCDAVGLTHADHRNFYRKIRARITTWKAHGVFVKLDKRATNKEYKKGEACANTRVIIIGGGVCGLRVAIETALLGARTVVVEKRDRFSRNNVLHLWPFLITDLKNLGAKKFFGKFCAGAIDHISIRQLQCILLKVALLVGVEVHTNVGFIDIIEPTEPGMGWRVKVDPANHPLSEYEFDVLIGADGKRNTLQGFKRKEFRGKLAIAITANFINRNTQAEARVEEISGVAFIFNQKFFKDLNAECNIDLENIVYYKDETHYFVMTAKKQSLLEKGVLKQDFSDTAMLLARDNVDQDELANYAREAADFATNHQLPHLDFAVNHYGQADLAMFDFTSLFQAENASRVVERHGKKLLKILVGDSLLEPFWPTGSGCARGFLGAFDAAWMIKNWSSGRMTPLQVIAERESVYQLLSQTTPENLRKNYNQFTLDPSSRYTNMKAKWLKAKQVMHLYDTGENTLRDEIIEMPSKFGKDDVIDPYSLLRWAQKILNTGKYRDVDISDLSTCWRSGFAFCALIHYFKPEAIDFDSLNEDDIIKNNQLAFDIAKHEFGIQPEMTGEDMFNCDVPDKLTIISYLTKFHDLFKKQRPPSEEILNTSLEDSRKHRSPSHRLSILAKIRSSRASLSKLKKSIKKENNPEDVVAISTSHSSTSYNINSNSNNNYERLHSKNEELLSHPIKAFVPNGNVELKRFSKLPMEEISSKLNVGVPRTDGKEIRLREEMMPVVKVSKMAEILVSKFQSNADQPLNTPVMKRVKGQPMMVAAQPASEFCFFCKKRVYIMERMTVENVFFHTQCFKCDFCDISLRANTYTVEKTSYGDAKRFFCARHATPVSRFGRPARKRLADTDDSDARSVPSSRIEGTGPPPSKVSAGSQSPKKTPLLSPVSSGGEPPSCLKTPERIEFENTIEGLPEETEEEQYEHNLSMSMTFDGKFEFPPAEEDVRNGDESDSSDSDLEELLSEMDVDDYEEVAHMLQSWDEGEEFQEVVDLYNSGRLEESIVLAKESLRRSQENLFEEGYQRLAEEEEEEEDTEVEYTEEEPETGDSDTEMEEDVTEPSNSNKPHTSTPSSKEHSACNKPRSTGINTAVSQESRANFFTSPAEPIRLDPFKMFGMARKNPTADETVPVAVPTKGEEVVEPEVVPAQVVGEMDSDEGTDSQVGSGVLDNKSAHHESQSRNTDDECEDHFLTAEHEPTTIDEDEEVMEKTAVSRAMEQLLYDMDRRSDSLSDNNDPVLKSLSGDGEDEEGEDDVFHQYRKQLSSVDSLSGNEEEAKRSRSSGDFCEASRSKTSSSSEKSGSVGLKKGSLSGSKGLNTGSEMGATERSVLRSVKQMTGKSNSSGNGESTLEVLRSVERNGDEFQHIDDRFVTRTRGSSRKSASKRRSQKGRGNLKRSDSSDSITISTPSQASSRHTSNSSLSDEFEYNRQFLNNESDDDKPDSEMLRDYQLTLSHALGEDSDELSPHNESPVAGEDLDQTINAEESGATSPKSEYLSPRSDIGDVSDNKEFVSPRSGRNSSSVYITPNSSMEPEALAELKSVSPPQAQAISKTVLAEQSVAVASGKKKKISTAKKIKKVIKQKLRDTIDQEPVLTPQKTSTIIRPSRSAREGSIESNHLERNEWGSSNSSLNSIESCEPIDKKSWRPLPPLPKESQNSPVQSKSVKPGSGRVLPAPGNMRPLSPHQAFQSNFMKKLYSSNGESSSEDKKVETNVQTSVSPVPKPIDTCTSPTLVDTPYFDAVITAQPRPLPRRPAVVKKDQPNRPVMKKASEYCTMARPQEKIGVVKPSDIPGINNVNSSSNSVVQASNSVLKVESVMSPVNGLTSPKLDTKVDIKTDSHDGPSNATSVASSTTASCDLNKTAEKTKVTVDYSKLKFSFDNDSGSEAESKKKRIPVAVSLKQSLKPKLSGTSTTSVEEAVADIPFADDSDDEDAATDDKFFTPVTSKKPRPSEGKEKSKEGKRDVKKRILPEPPVGANVNMPNANHIRDIRKAEIEKAREEARDRARLKSDEELGIRETPFKRANSSDINYESSTSNPPDRVSDSDYFTPRRIIPAVSFTPDIPVSNGTPTRTKEKKKKKKSKDRESTGLSTSGDNLESGTKREKKKRSILASLLSNVKTPNEKSRDVHDRDRSSSTDNLEDSVIRKKKTKTPKTDKKKKEKKRKSASVGTEEMALSSNMEGLKIGSMFTEKIKHRPAFRRHMLPPKASVDDFTDSEEDFPSITTSVTSLTESRRIKSDHGPMSEDELNARITRKIQHAARKQQKQQEQKRLRQAQEIQRKLQEVDVKQRELEERGVTVERGLRQEGPLAGKPEAELMQMWFNLVREKNALVRTESELMVNARELELEDRQGRLQQQLRESIALDDSVKSPLQQAREKKIYNELIEVVEERDKLVAMLEEERVREREEDRDLEEVMRAKGFSLSPVSKHSKASLNT